LDTKTQAYQLSLQRLYRGLNGSVLECRFQNSLGCHGTCVSCRLCVTFAACERH